MIGLGIRRAARRAQGAPGASAPDHLILDNTGNPILDNAGGYVVDNNGVTKP